MSTLKNKKRNKNYKEGESSMTTGVVAIYMVEKDYVERLMEYLEGKAGLPFEIVAFTVQDELERFLETKVIDILLVGEEETLTVKDEHIKRKVLLTSGIIPPDLKEYPNIFKYQSMDIIIKGILDNFLQVWDEDYVVVNKGDCKIVGVYSPFYIDTKNTFAITLGQILTTENKTLYINLEEYSAFDKLFNKEYIGDLSDLMYFFGQNKEVLSVKLQAIVENINRMDYIPPLIYSEDLRNIETHKWIELIRQISIVSGYEYIVLDLGNMISNVYELLDICDVIYIPTERGYLKEEKLKSFEECILRSGKEALMDKCIKVTPPKVDERPWTDEYFEELSWGELGEYIKKIIGEDKWSLMN